MSGGIKWSNSALTTLQNCGERFRRRYLEREWSKPSARMLRGTVVHKVASRAYHQKLQALDLPTVEEAKDVAATEFEAAWRGGVVLSADEAAEGPKVTRAKAKDFAVDLSGFHIETVAPAINPIGVERKIEVRPKDSDLVIHGTIDLIDAPTEGREVIRDLKTSEKSPFANAAETSQQLSMYAMIRMAEIGTLPDKLVLDTLVRTPVKAEKKHVIQETTRDRDDVRALVERLNTAVAAVQRGIFVPASSDWWGCSAQYCDFYHDCRFVRRGDRRPAN